MKTTENKEGVNIDMLEDVTPADLTADGPGVYAVACGLQDCVNSVLTLSVNRSVSRDEAIGKAVSYALKAKPHMAVRTTLCTKVSGEGGSHEQDKDKG